MYRLCHSDCEQLLELTADLYSCRLEEGWRGRLLRRIRALIPFEFGGCHLIERDQHQIDACYEPCRPPMPAANKDFWRLVKTHPMNGLLFGQPLQSWKVSDVISRMDFRQSELYQALYQPLKVDCELAAAVPFRSNPQRLVLLTLHRFRVDFTERDRAVLNLLLPHIARLQWSQESRALWDRPPCAQVLPTELFAATVRRETRWSLTPREMEVLFWVHQGKTNSEIGKILGISERTAETHILRAYPKIGVENRHSAMAVLNRLIR
ncbi:MAG: hypothetical protein JNN07_05530 [Verrucomicrobiales bacterium]|nr:hypothetical protein [Verrucomicrobiales bacterium]